MGAYKKIVKPILFQMNPEFVHECTSRAGYVFGLLGINYLRYQHIMLEQNIDGINFSNPVGLGAGFDYDAWVAKVMRSFGFGFNTVGTVTALPYVGNTGPRLGRLPKSKSLFVNKGFKSPGVEKIDKRLSSMGLLKNTIGVSIGSSNIDEVDSRQKAVDDCLKSFSYLKDKDYIKYFELNISCPNTKLPEPFTSPTGLTDLVKNVTALGIKKPIYVKMPNELSLDDSYELVKVALNHGLEGFIFSNLVKDRNNPFLDQEELAKWEGMKGNFSGKPTKENSDKLLRHIYSKVQGFATLIGLGGVFSAEDAYTKIKNGANLVQLVTGLIYEGPSVATNINKGLVKLLEQDGYDHISQAVGSAV